MLGLGIAAIVVFPFHDVFIRRFQHDEESWIKPLMYDIASASGSFFSLAIQIIDSEFIWWKILLFVYIAVALYFGAMGLGKRLLTGLEELNSEVSSLHSEVSSLHSEVSSLHSEVRIIF